MKDKEPKPEVKTGEGLSVYRIKEEQDNFIHKLCNEQTAGFQFKIVNFIEQTILVEFKQSIIAEAIKALPKEKVLQNPPDIDDLGDMQFNMCLSEVKQILERISLSADIKRKENL